MNDNIIFIKEINFLINDFLKTINKEDVQIYFSNKEINSSTNFNDFIKNISKEQINFLNDNISYSIKCLKKLDVSLLNQNINLDYDLWKICVFDNMFFNLPFTLQDVIFIPISYISSSMEKTNFLDILFNKDNINKKFSRTLIHEKIHLLQRYNENIWDTYILENTNWSITNKDLIKNFSLFGNNKIIYNPDTFYVKSKFIYNQKNNYYYGQMLLTSKKEISNIWYCIREKNNKFNLYPDINFTKKYEHPYEELAYIMSDDLHNN